jgi:hypothetical protein
MKGEEQKKERKRKGEEKEENHRKGICVCQLQN